MRPARLQPLPMDRVARVMRRRRTGAPAWFQRAKAARRGEGVRR